MSLSRISSNSSIMSLCRISSCFPRIISAHLRNSFVNSTRQYHASSSPIMSRYGISSSFPKIISAQFRNSSIISDHQCHTSNQFHSIGECHNKAAVHAAFFPSKPGGLFLYNRAVVAGQVSLFRHSFPNIFQRFGFSSVPSPEKNNAPPADVGSRIGNNGAMAQAIGEDEANEQRAALISEGTHLYRERKKDRGEIEEGTLYPGLSCRELENQLRWGFIRKVYGTVGAQLVLTAAVASAAALHSPVIIELLSAHPSLICSLCVLPLGLLVPMHVYQKRHPLNLIFLGLFNASFGLTLGLGCAMTDGRIVLEALGLTSAAVASLTGYAFWAAKKGKDFSHLGPILFPNLVVLALAGVAQIFFPLGSTADAIYGAICAAVFSGYMVYDTDSLIKRFKYDEYIMASVNLYLDILNLFVAIMRVLRATSSSSD